MIGIINANSRYTTAVIQTVEAHDGPRQEMRVPLPRARQIEYTYYRIIAGDRIDLIANAFYGDPTVWWMIANANPEILDWLDLQVGDVIRIPNA